MTATVPELSLDLPGDDVVIVFRTIESGARGRLVRLGATAGEVIAAHRLPAPAAEALGQALCLAALVGATLPSAGRLILQARAEGPLSLIVADYEGDGKIRGYASLDRPRFEMLSERPHPSALIGAGHLALTLDPGPGEQRYQSLIELSGHSMVRAAADYLENNEAMPTFLRVASADVGPAGGPTGGWRCGGLMLQGFGDLTDETSAENWARARMLAETVGHLELVDPAVAPARLLLRLFHEEGVVVERATRIERHCRCSRSRVADVLNSFSDDERAAMNDDSGAIVVTCEFCATQYAFAKSELN